MTFDNSPPDRPSPLQVARDHLPLALLVGAAVGVAAGIHFASVAVVALAAGHLVVAGLLLVARRLSGRRTEAATR